ncbi:MAG: ABC transporter permease [Lachnospiraceae bacterium]
MKKSDLRGWRDVFSFTVVQTVKSKAYIGTLIFMCILVLLSMPIMNLIMSDDMTEGPEKSAIEKVYIYNMTMYQQLDYQSELTPAYRNIVFENARESYEVVEARLAEEEKNSVLLLLAEDETGSYLQFVKSPNGDVGNYELQILGQSFQNAFTKAKIRALGISETQMAALNTSIIASTSVVDTKSAVVLEDTSISQSEYWLVYGILFIVLMISVMASSQVATSVVTEKSSKVLEYLLTSIRPLALIVGKVLAMLVTVMLQMVLMILAGYVSTKLGGLLFGTTTNAITQFISPEVLANLNFLNIFLGLAAAGAGLVLYATLAGLCGATVSRMEEASESLTFFTLTALVGAYIGMGAAGSLMGVGDNAFVTFALLFPISSAYLLPGALLIGKAEPWIAVLAIVILLASVVLLFRFVARVYETLILHNGNRIKMKELFAISKASKASK